MSFQVAGFNQAVSAFGNVGAHSFEEGIISQQLTQSMNCQCATFVYAVVEHILRAGVGQQNILWQRLQASIKLQRTFRSRLNSSRLKPEPFGVAGETFVEPDVVPLGKAK